jgi:hypothetical protein
MINKVWFGHFLGATLMLPALFGSAPKISSMRKLILASLDWTRPKDPAISLGQASILANLRRHNIPVHSINIPVLFLVLYEGKLIKFMDFS